LHHQHQAKTEGRGAQGFDQGARSSQRPPPRFYVSRLGIPRNRVRSTRI